MSKEQLRENKKRLYEIHDYDPRNMTKNVHHIIFRSEGGPDTMDNLSLIDVDLHSWLHQLIEKIEKNN